jgi:NADH-quinone oxidoreductase subunit M
MLGVFHRRSTCSSSSSSGKSALVPMYFLINQWGSANRNYASLKFLIFTMGGSLGLLLLAIQLLGVLFGTYDLLALYPALDLAGCLVRPCWACRSHTVKDDRLLGVCRSPSRSKCRSGRSTPGSPTRTPKRRPAGSMILGRRAAQTRRLRLLCGSSFRSIPLEAKIFRRRARRFPCGGGDRLWRLGFLRPNRLQAAGRVLVGESHGICRARHRRGRLGRTVRPTRHIALNGAILQMFNHGLIRRRHVLPRGRDLRADSHAQPRMTSAACSRWFPMYGGILIFTSMASLGLPGLNGFISEFLSGARSVARVDDLHRRSRCWACSSPARTFLKANQESVLHGPMNEHWAHGEHKLD